MSPCEKSHLIAGMLTREGTSGITAAQQVPSWAKSKSSLPKKDHLKSLTQKTWKEDTQEALFLVYNMKSFSFFKRIATIFNKKQKNKKTHQTLISSITVI